MLRVKYYLRMTAPLRNAEETGGLSAVVS